MAVYDHSGDIVFRILTQSFLCSANNDEEVGSSSVPRNITTTINAAQVDQTNLKAQFRLPIAYHGRASSIVISGTDIIRSRLG
ncbi:hypothetical protein F2Q68_00001041 [Brassica cretica]|uniref:Uncharacterized protein n=1 Tax=Brassica cretica TaxID=69181 RepID=A0A8S9JMG2_BRACR|nr:hypothetical protein F2Q68_00001041 [Brassica cretica]